MGFGGEQGLTSRIEKTLWVITLQLYRVLSVYQGFKEVDTSREEAFSPFPPMRNRLWEV